MPVFDPVKNLGYSLVTVAPVTPTAGLSFTVRTGEGARYPSTGAFQVTVWPQNVIPEPTNAEVWRITGVAGDVLTGTRAQEGSTAMPVAVGYQVVETVTAKMVTDIQNATIANEAFAFFS